MLSKTIRSLYYSLFLLTPLLVFSHTSELFEFNKMHFIYFAALVIGLLWVIDMIRRRTLLIVSTPFDVGLGVFLIAHVLSFLFSIDKHVSLVGYYGRLNGGILSLIAFVVLAYALPVYMDKRHIMRLLKYSLITSVVVVGIGLPGWVGYDSLCWLLAQTPNNSCWTAQFRPAERMFSTLGQANWLAAYLGANLMIALGLFATMLLGVKRQNRSMTKMIMYAVVIVVATAGILMTRSRSGLIAVGVGGAIMMLSLWLTVPKARWADARRIGMALAIVLVLLVFAVKTGVEQVDWVLSWRPTSKPVQSTATTAIPSPQPSTVTDSFAIRTIVWTGAAELIKRYPLTGTGVETFAYAYPMVRPQAHNLTSEWDFVYNKAHNEYLNYAATLGLGGLVGYLWFQGAIIYVGWRAWRKKKQESKGEDGEVSAPLVAGITTSIIVIALTNAVGFSTSTVQLMLYLFPMGMLILTDRVESFHLDKAPAASLKKNTLGYAAVFVTGAFCLIGLTNSYTADTLYAQANTYLDANDPQKAVSYLSRAVDLNPTEHVYQDKLGQALAQLALVASLSPESGSSAAELARLSEKYEQNALDASPKNTTYWRNFGKNELLIYQIKGDISPLQKSLNAFARSAELAPTDPRPIYSECVVYSLLAGEQEDKQLELEEQSLDCTDEVIKLKPDYFDAYVLKGQLLQSYKLTAELEAWLAHTKRQFPYISPQNIESEMGIVAQ